MYRGMGAVDVMGASWCGSGNPFIDFFCSEESKKSRTEQIITDTSNYGPALTPESRTTAEDMARTVIAADDPCNYAEINDMGWFDKAGCYAKESIVGRGKQGPDFTTVALIVAAVAAFSLVRN